MAETGSLAPARQGRPPGGGKLAPYRDLLIGWVEREGEITIPPQPFQRCCASPEPWAAPPELADRLARERQVVALPASLSRFLKAEGFTVKNAAGERSRTR